MLDVYASSPEGNGVFSVILDSNDCAAAEQGGGLILVSDRAVTASKVRHNLIDISHIRYLLLLVVQLPEAVLSLRCLRAQVR